MNAHSPDDLRSFNSLYDDYSGIIFANILKMVKDHETAQELLQDIFVKVWEKRGLIEAGKPWHPYLFQIAKHHVYDHFRKGAVHRKFEAYLETTKQEAYTHIEEDIILKESNNLLCKAIEKLSPQRKQVYTLCKIEGKSYFEISHLLGISTSTVSDHMLKANRFIRAELHASGVFAAFILMLSLSN